MAGKGGGAWKVAYADFVTAMMAFFLVMWITAQSKEVKESIASYFEDPLGSSDTPKLMSREGLQGASSIGPVEFGGLHTRGLAEADPNSSPKIDSKNTEAMRLPRIKMFQNKGTSQSVGTMVIFQEDTAEMTEAARNQLEAILPALRGKPNKIEIRGHSSRKPPPDGSPFKSPWELCYARCIATMEYMAANGISRERFRLSQDGSAEPYSRRREKEWKELNSRVEVFAINEFVSDLKRGDPPGGFFGEHRKPTREETPGDPRH
ncbi:MAG: OmpA family protein [Planctomycetaceae bacterium]|nr:OmpA family protein [Planctomycetaceae bacterium]